MKNLFKQIVVAIALSLTLSASAVNLTITMPANSCSNLLGSSFNGYALVTAASLTASTNVPVISFYDGVTNSRAQVQSAYTNYTEYVTNQVTTWVNYLGATNSYTNAVLLRTTNTVAATTNTIPLLYSISAEAGTTVTASPLSIPIRSGLWVTNATTNSATLTLTVIQ